ncbi:MAG: sugar ABC transporter ATP-binding protein [Christensenella sp.]|uniref:sugar ABC transporter ATP-binding protein n=1 Tax=Christensenella sp. TaxID=1935934 RepID=UPI002B220C3C|nr:sugar ABC transporter ATP-binding protein [Christensenella sp.]MEA5003431.1 sugar ABC transporter ATP-binding protein [Christensenella sp.]
MNYVLELSGIGKTFAGVNVLRGIDLQLKKGEVHVLLGENGAGKSTLIKIISGYHKQDKGGSLKVDGKEMSFKRPKDAIDASIHTIYQELTLCPYMTVAENIVIDKQDHFSGGTLKTAEFRKIAEEALKKLGQPDIDPDALVRNLSIAQQQVVEIAKAISANAKIVLMDEPTSSISQKDADRLLQIVRNLRDEGVTVIYISHRLQEIGQIADRITVLRDGNLVKTVEQKDITDKELISMMVGRDITNTYPKREVELGDVVLKLDKIKCEGVFEEVSLEVRAGEIFGIGGIVGAKRTEILEAIFGIRKITSGKMYLKGKEYDPSEPRDAIKNKIAFVTEDRKKSGLVLCLPVMENSNMINVQKKSKFGYIDWKAMRKMAQRQKERLSIKLNDIDQRVDTLSGGNQQKVVLAKWMDFEPDVILFDEPTRGVDIGAKTEIYNIMGELAEKGVAIVMVSSELPELISVTDQIMVMREGVMKGILDRSEATQELIMSLATMESK